MYLSDIHLVHFIYSNMKDNIYTKACSIEIYRTTQWKGILIKTSVLNEDENCTNNVKI